MRLCKEEYREIKEMVGMRQAAGFYGYPPDRRGNCICPFHQDRHPSMKIYPHNRGYYCFSCGSGGDVITFVGRLYGLDNEQAAKKLINDFSLPIKTEGLSYRENREQSKKIRKQMQMKEFYTYAKNVLSVYRQMLCDAIRNPEDPDFTEACQELSIVEYRLSCLETDLEDYFNDKKAVKKIGKIRERITGWHEGSDAVRTISG